MAARTSFSVDWVDTVDATVTVVSPQLVAVGAAWADGPAAGGWIADRLAPFGARVGHAVPLGYPAYAVVPVAPDADLQTEGGYLSVFEGLRSTCG